MSANLSFFTPGPVADLLTLGKFGVLMADPPWRYSNSGFHNAAAKQYETMSTADICAMQVQDIAEDNAVLFLWATNPLLLDAVQVMAAWGFTYKTNFVWTKTQHVGGFYTLGKHELLLVGTRGSVNRPDKYFASHFHAARSVHSRKPGLVVDAIAKMYPNATRIELFARFKRSGWSSWGNDAEVCGYIPTVGGAS